MKQDTNRSGVEIHAKTLCLRNLSLPACRPVVGRLLHCINNLAWYNINYHNNSWGTSHLYPQPVWNMHTDSGLLHIDEKSAVLWVEKKVGEWDKSGEVCRLNFFTTCRYPLSHIPYFPFSLKFSSSPSFLPPLRFFFLFLSIVFFPLLNHHLVLFLSPLSFSSSPLLLPLLLPLEDDAQHWWWVRVSWVGRGKEDI